MTAKFTATPDIIVVDNAVAANGTTDIAYSKDGRFENLFERRGSTSYKLIDVAARTGTPADQAEFSGHYQVTLSPGDVYQVTAFPVNHGPFDSDPEQFGTLMVFCIWKAPAAALLVTDQNRETGGTYHWHQIHTNQVTNIVTIGLSQTAPVVDSNGIPRLLNTEGQLTTTPDLNVDHKLEITPLVPGHHYFFVALVTDIFGNWQVVQEVVDTKLRVVNVAFTEMTIFDDGDDLSTGEGEFWFEVFDARDKVASFHLPTMTIDDYGGAGKTYPITFGPHVIGPKAVDPKRAWVGVYSHATEHDGWFEADDRAATVFGPRSLPIPHGRLTESVLNQPMFVDCAPTSGSLHYSIKAEFSVVYV